jgi:two-component sensor histidine kinase
VHYPLKGENGEVAAVGVIIEDVTERKHAEQRQEILINELNHRVKNTLSVIQSIAMQTLKNANKRDDAYEAFQARLMGLAAAHDILTRRGWEPADIREIVTRAVAPYRGGPDDRFRIKGPSLPVGGKATIAFALALNELCTNSAKYGALSIPTGRVEVEWTANGELHLVWKELGGPPVRPPTHQGFGSFLITRVLANEIDGKVEMDYRPSGLVCTVETSLQAIP